MRTACPYSLHAGLEHDEPAPLARARPGLSVSLLVEAEMGMARVERGGWCLLQGLLLLLLVPRRPASGRRVPEELDEHAAASLQRETNFRFSRDFPLTGLRFRAFLSLLAAEPAGSSERSRADALPWPALDRDDAFWDFFWDFIRAWASSPAPREVSDRESQIEGCRDKW